MRRKIANSAGGVKSGFERIQDAGKVADNQQVLNAYTARTRRPFHHVRDFLASVRSRQPPVANADLTRDAMGIALAADMRMVVGGLTALSVAGAFAVEERQLFNGKDMESLAEPLARRALVVTPRLRRGELDHFAPAGMAETL